MSYKINKLLTETFLTKNVLLNFAKRKRFLYFQDPPGTYSFSKPKYRMKEKCTFYFTNESLPSKLKTNGCFQG